MHFLQSFPHKLANIRAYVLTYQRKVVGFGCGHTSVTSVTGISFFSLSPGSCSRVKICQKAFGNLFIVCTNSVWIAKFRCFIFVLTKSQSLKNHLFFFFSALCCLYYKRKKKRKKILSGQIPISRKSEQMVCAHVGIIYFPHHKKKTSLWFWKPTLYHSLSPWCLIHYFMVLMSEFSAYNVLCALQGWSLWFTAVVLWNSGDLTWECQ